MFVFLERRTFIRLLKACDFIDDKIHDCSHWYSYFKYLMWFVNIKRNKVISIWTLNVRLKNKNEDPFKTVSDKKYGSKTIPISSNSIGARQKHVHGPHRSLTNCKSNTRTRISARNRLFWTENRSDKHVGCELRMRLKFEFIVRSKFEFKLL